ncbi:MAG TPA: hypothetical protein VFS77_22890 [Pyrinomonadaceae bacterium]|nr:hypothetical protein [Pyrinomonadaceae bacterium]
MRRFRLMMAPLATLVAAVVFGSSATVYAPPAKAQQSSKVTRPGKPIVHSNFEVDVLVDGRRLSKCYERGHTWVEAIRNAEYEIRLRNPTRERVAVALYVDGLNTIDSSRTPPETASKWLMEPYQTITISGWQRDSDHASRFYFTTERDSYAAKLGVRGTVGVIWAAFYRERRRRPIPITPYPRPYPSDGRESESPAEMRSSPEGAMAGSANKSRARDDAATGIGRSVRHDVEYVDVDLESRPSAEVTIRYEFGRSISESNPKYRVLGRPDN